ncbi:hypothetical protein JL722_5605 [Aureococcus anophagefferens]|nr:hypothetical protein JL722_5605 [Aureococcus anophagefferens]
MGNSGLGEVRQSGPWQSIEIDRTFVLGDESRLRSMRDRWAAEASQEDMRDRWAAEASQEDAAMERRDRSRSRERDDGMDELCNAMDYCYPDMPELVAASDDESDGGDALDAMEPCVGVPAGAVLSYYVYAAVADPEGHAAWQRATGAALGLRGRVVVAGEGVNGTLSGATDACDAYGAVEPLGAAVDVKRSPLAAGARPPFPDLYVKVGGEIVSTGLGAAVRASSETSAPHADAASFRDKLAAPDAADKLLVLDVRNGFDEDVVGRARGKEVLMYCTGGVRCEKASAYLRSKGVEAVHQLDGGIHRFLERYPDGGGVWKGRNFLFDAREADAYDAPPAPTAVGVCTDCAKPWGAHAARNICSVCETLCLVCPACSSSRREHYCSDHEDLRGAYCHFLDACDAGALEDQARGLAAALEAPAAKKSVNRRRSLRKQLDRVRARLGALAGGAAVYAGPPRCRSCGQVHCDGCWGFWKACAES